MWSIFAPEALTSPSEVVNNTAASCQSRTEADSGRSSMDATATASGAAAKSGRLSDDAQETPGGNAKKANGVGSQRGGNGSGAGASQAAKQRQRRQPPQARSGEDAAAVTSGPQAKEGEEEDWVEAQSKRLGRSQKASTKQAQKQKDAIDEAQRVLSSVWALTQAHPSVVPTYELLALFPLASPLLSVAGAKASSEASPKRGSKGGASQAAGDAQPSQTGAPAPVGVYETSHGGRGSSANTNRRGNAAQRGSGGSGKAGGAGGVRVAYVQVLGQTAGAAENPTGATVARSGEQQDPPGKPSSGRNNRQNKASSSGEDAGADKPSTQHRRHQQTKQGHGAKQGQAGPVIRNDRRGEAGSRHQKPPHQQVPTAAEDDDAVGDMIRRKLREAMTIEDLQLAVNEARGAGLIFEAQLGEKKLLKMSAGGF
ncbi:hypothetical protein BESB_040610 [Besnoitia besnoiti]|uniref:Uncharacterized protein n=1 Tax=Besnoitia besnoiti TaxID=94643 RepID=A0A2A9MNR4_BESBE|nr:hypothetical protein BESB_040610 [Besnoitia besnoiti]PFH37603.1 hypothetical protein BESB_040610 [Besnoitia besnoiti]